MSMRSRRKHFAPRQHPDANCTAAHSTDMRIPEPSSGERGKRPCSGRTSTSSALAFVTDLACTCAASASPRRKVVSAPTHVHPGRFDRTARTVAIGVCGSQSLWRTRAAAAARLRTKHASESVQHNPLRGVRRSSIKYCAMVKYRAGSNDV